MSVTSIDHLVGSYHEGQRHVEANRPGGFDVDNELDLHSLLKWEVGRFGALEDLSSVESKLTLLCVPKTSSVLIARPNRLNVSGDDRPLLPPPAPSRLPPHFH